MEGMNTPRLNTETHRLTNFPGDKHPYVCQKCGGSNVKGFGNGLMRLALDRWQECDHNDKPEHRLIVLCEKCSKAIIEPHPRLYQKLHANAPWPGCMAICVECRLRDGITCTSPDAKANGGPGVVIAYQEPPIRGFIDGKKYRGPFEEYPKPPFGCHQKRLWQPVK